MPLSKLPAPLVTRGLRLLAGSTLLAGLLACGYKGPLYLPPPEAPSSELTTPPVQQAAPTAGFVSPLDPYGQSSGGLAPLNQDDPTGPSEN